MALLGGVGVSPASSRVVASDDRGVVIECAFEVASVGSDRDGGLVLLLAGGDIERQPGLPNEPVVTLNVAVPPGSRPRVRLVSRESGSRYDGQLAVEPARVGAQPTPFRLPEPVGETELRSLLGITYLRVPLRPAVMGSGSFEVARRMTVRVDYNAPPPPVVLPPARINNLHRLALLNLENAAGWGRAITSNFTDPSWPQGDIYRFEIDEESIYRLSFEELKRGGVQLPDGGVASGSIKVYGNGGGELPLDPTATAPLGLSECAIFVDDRGDGRFGPGDEVLFYGKGAGGWVPDTSRGLRFDLNHYTVRNVYFLVVDPSGGGKRMEGLGVELLPVRSETTGRTRVHIEPEKFIFGIRDFRGSGREWYAYMLPSGGRYSLTAHAAGIDLSQPATVFGRVVLPTFSGLHRVTVTLNGTSLGGFTPEAYSSFGTWSFPAPPEALREGGNSIAFSHAPGSGESMIDWVDLTYFGQLDRHRFFDLTSTVGAVEYRSTGLADPWFFDVTDHANVRQVRRTAVTILQTGSAGRLLLTTRSSFRSPPTRFEAYFPPPADIADPWSRANRADVILVTPDAYYDLLPPLVEHLTRRDPPLRAVRMRASELYNRFSGGLKDPAAIRNMLHYAKDFWATPPRYVIYCGDGDYNYRDLDRPRQDDLLPPFELGDLCSDDWFSDFTPRSQDGVRDPLPEMISGRLTAQSAYELSAMIAKIVAYDEEPEFGDWRNRATMVADDEFGESWNGETDHVRDTELISNSYLPPTMDKVKIYLTEYARQWGREKPQSGIDLVNSINRGTLLVNYMGHGNPTLWAHEHVFVQSRDFPQIEPSRRQALYIAFTCDWAYWDDPASQSFPEQLLAAPGRGAIMAIASTRLTYAGSNRNLALNFFLNLFRADSLTPGEALWLGKYQWRGNNSASYHLLGDPTLALATPKRRGNFTTLTPYPLRPLARSSVAGEVFGRDGRLDPSFTGELYFILRDAAVQRRYTIMLDGQPYATLNYLLPGVAVYRGFLSVGGGRFAAGFVPPRDVTLGGSYGRAVAYYYDGEVDGVIARDSLAYARDVAEDNDSEPPEIRVFFDHRNYRPGDRVGPEPLLIVEVSDSSGLNLTGAMGHGINLRIDGGTQQDLTTAFRYELDSYQSGSLERRIGPLSPGLRRFEIEAWDAFNNLGVHTVDVDIIAGSGGLRVDRVLNWPNPFNRTTDLTFVLSEPADRYEIRIFTVAGRMIRKFDGGRAGPGQVTGTIWDGRDQAGREAGNGVYLYKVIAYGPDGGSAEGMGRIAFIR